MAPKQRAQEPDPERRFVDRFALALTDVGFPRMPSRVLVATMCAAGHTVTAGELADRLDASPAAMSGALRYLVQVNLLEREAVQGSRSQHYRVPDNAWYESLAHRQGLLTRLAESGAEGLDALPAGSLGRMRISEMLDFFTFLDRELPNLIEKWRSQRAEDRAGATGKVGSRS